LRGGRGRGEGLESIMINNPLLIENNPFSPQETRVLLPGAVGQLEAIVRGPDTRPTIIGIVCHPHPLQGGTFNNKVVTTIARTWFKQGLGVIRFNFRGVGASEGHYAKGVGETDDLLAVIDCVQAAYPDSEIWLGGFSFGSYVVLRAAQQRAVGRLVTVAPPVGNFDFNVIKRIACPWLVIQGDSDEIISAQEVYAWLQQFSPPPHVIRFPQTGHFFHGKLGELQSALEKE
jgi:alpha/beta superfamily hydrolase